jgi:hypothetical protein
MKNNNSPFRLKTLLVPVAAGLGALMAPSAGAVEALLAVDAYVSASQPATNFGKAETLPVGNGNRALLRFDVASMLPAGTAAGQVSKAVLQVWVSGVTKAGSVEVSELLGSWTEPGVTHAALPGVGPAFATKAVSTAGRWVPINITNHVKKWLNDPTANKGLLIAPAASAPNTAVALDSKENTATSHPARLEIELAGTLGGSYTLTVGKNAGDNTGRSQLAVADFTTLTEALNKIPNNLYSNGVCSARYLVKVLPGVYSERVTMKPCVDIEGSGELTTRITAAGGANWDAASATVTGASEAELRFLTVENTGGQVAMGIYNYSASPRLTHVAAIAFGSSSYGVYNRNSSSPVMTNVTATATASGGSSYSYGVYNYESSSPRMDNVIATGSGGSIYNNGVWNSDQSSPTMTNVTATASGGGTYNYGVVNISSSSPVLTSITATAKGGNNNFGVYNHTASAIISSSTLRGGTNSLFSNNVGTIRVGASQLDGPVSTVNGATITCAASYNGSFAVLGANCQ